MYIQFRKLNKSTDNEVLSVFTKCSIAIAGAFHTTNIMLRSGLLFFFLSHATEANLEKRSFVSCHCNI